MVHNLGGSAQAVELDLGKFAGAAPIELFGETRFPPIGERPYMLSLAPYGYYWFRLRQGSREEITYGIEGSVI
jgi:maltose alpha-D-glucosyltransferase/alpha-amylase